MDWLLWWRKRLEADLEAAMRCCKGNGNDPTTPLESASPDALGANPSTRRNHLELARCALLELLGESVGSADHASGNSDPRTDLSPALSDRLDSLHAAVESLRGDVLAAIGKADRSASIIDSLEAENRGLKRRESERKQESLIKAVISLFDDLRSVARHAQSEAAAGGRQEPELLQSLLVFERQALELLRRSHVEAFEPRVADPFDVRTQEVGATVEAGSPDQDMRIAEVLRLGFEFDGRVIRPAAVKVYRFRGETAPRR